MAGQTSASAPEPGEAAAADPSANPSANPPANPSANPSAAASSRAGPRTKRVPDNQRRRAAVSCDHCKQRRAKCMRASPRDPCSNCISSHIKCQSTLPRKQRVYGSVESLSLRYRALEALVQGLLQGPGHDPRPTKLEHGSEDEDMDADGGGGSGADGETPVRTTLDLDALYKAAADRGIPMPPREDMTPVTEIFAATSGQTQPAPASSATSTPTIVALPTIVPPPVLPPANTTSLPPLSAMASAIPTDSRFTSPFRLPHPPQQPQQQTITTPAADEKLIPTPHGVAHYVGPSSSFRFVTSIRALVAQCGDSIITGLNGGGVATAGASEAGSGVGASPATGSGRSGQTPSVAGDAGQTSIRDEFVSLKTSKALEIRDSGGDDDDDEGDESAEYSAESGADDDAMDGVVREDRPHHHSPQYQSPNTQYPSSGLPPPQPQQQQSLPTRQYGPRSSYNDVGASGGAMSAPSPSNSRRSRPEYDDPSLSSTFLPPRETADIFVRVFFDRVHPNYPLFHRGSFLLRYEALWQRDQAREAGPGGAGSRNLPVSSCGDSGGDDDYGWNCCLAMVFAFGAQALEGHDRARRAAASMQRRYLHLVCSSLSRLAGTTNLANVQALLLLQLYEHNAGRRNAAWTFLGCASRMAVALGMHRDGVVIPLGPMGSTEAKSGGASGASPSSEQIDDRHARRRVWWTLYSFERNLCIMLGRPSALDETEIAVAPPLDDTQSADLPQGLSASLLELIRFTWKIKQIRFPAPGSLMVGGYGSGYAGYSSSADAPYAARTLLAELETWRVELPAHLQPGWKSMIPSHRRAVLMLHVQHQYGRSLATRQFVLDRAERCRQVAAAENASGKVTEMPDRPSIVHDDLADTCLSASEGVLDYLQQLFDEGLLDGVAWIDVYYMYHSVLILCLDLVAKLILVAQKSSQKSSAATAAERSSIADAITRRRAAVRSILLTAQRTRLAPTFRVLVSVACQLATIVGALDGVLTLPPPATTIDGSLAATKQHHHGHYSHHGRPSGTPRSHSSTRGRGRRRRYSSSGGVSHDRTTSTGTFSSGRTATTGPSMPVGTSANTTMAPPPASSPPLMRSAAAHHNGGGNAMSDASSPGVFYSPPAQTQSQAQSHYRQQQQPPQQHPENPQHQLQVQQLQAFAGPEWFPTDLSSYSWQPFEATSMGVGANASQAARTGPGAGGTGSSGPSDATNTSVASAAAHSVISALSAHLASGYGMPQGIDFGAVAEPSTFSEDPYMAQPDIFGSSGGIAGGRVHNGNMGSGQAYSAGSSGNGMDMDHGGHYAQHAHNPHSSAQNHQQQHYAQQQAPQMDNSEWVQAWRELSTRYY